MGRKSQLLEQFSAVEIYELVLQKKIDRFPPFFWKDDFSYLHAKEIGVYVIEKHFQNQDEKILDSYGNSFINGVKLHSVLRLFNGKAFDYINYLYPNRFRPWEFRSCPNAYWNLENAIDATIWLIEACLQWSPDQVKNNLTYNIFVENKLSGMLSQVYDDSVYAALNSAYPNKYKPWELVHTPKNYWKDKENVLYALTWLFKDKLNWTEKIVTEKLTVEVLVQNGMSGLLRWYGGIPYDIIKEIYPNIDWVSIQRKKSTFINTK